MGGRDAGRASGPVADGRGEPDAERTVTVVHGPSADRPAPEPAASAERQDEAEGAVRRDGPPSDSEAKRGEGTRDGAAAGHSNLGDRLRSLGAPGWTGRDAEWLALACLHGGVFLRPQYLAFLGRSHPEVVVADRNAERLTAAGRVVDGWVSTPAACDAHCEAVAAELAERTRRDEEIASIRTAIATLNDAALATYGGLNEAVARCVALETAATEATRVKPMINHWTDMAVSKGTGANSAPGTGYGNHANLKALNRFRDSASERIFEGRLPAEIQRRAHVRLQRVLAAAALSDLRLPPSPRLKALRGDRKGQYSIRINDQWRICFRWTDRDARKIEVTDYH